MQQAWDKNGRIYYIDNNGNKVQPKTTKNAFERLGMQAKAGLGNLNRWLQNTDTNSQSYKDKVNVALGILTAPIGGSSALAAKGAGVLTPFVGKKIAQNIASGAVGGATGGAVEGFGRGLIEKKNPIKTAVQDGTIGLVTGALGGAAGGKIGQVLDRRALGNNTLAPEQYFADYVEGLSNNTPLGQVSRFDKGLADFRLAKEGAIAGGDNTLFDSSNPLHVKQAELINKYNPANDDYHTWIRNADDIHTFEDTLKDPAYIDGGDFDPSYSRDMALQAIKDGEIDVYSSYPIDKGIFVSPSYMEAEQYAGGLGGKVYSKRVPLNDVAWIDPTQGQYAPIRELPKPVIKEETPLSGKIPPYKESNFYKQRQARLKARENPRQLSNSDNNLYEKLVNMSKDYKKGEYNPLKYKGKSVKIDNISPKQKEYIFNEINSTISDLEKEKGYITRRLHNYDEKTDYLYTIIYDNNGNHQITRSIKIDNNIYD